MPDPIKPYLKQIEAALAAGNATEHTHRPALKALVEALAPSITAINEPQRIACGAPDFVIQRADLTGFRKPVRSLQPRLHRDQGRRQVAG